MGQIKVEKNVGGIKGLCVIEPAVHGDARGYFMETYNEKDMKEAGIDMNHIIFSKSTVQSRKKRGANRCKTFSFNGWNKFLSDSIIFNFIVILCTTHVMTGSVVAGNLTSISCHSGA